MKAVKVKKKEAIFNYLRDNPSAKNTDIAKACGVHHTYVSLVRRNAGVKKPKAVKITKKVENVKASSAKGSFEEYLTKRNAELLNENISLKDDITRLFGVVEYLESKLRHAATVRGS